MLKNCLYSRQYQLISQLYSSNQIHLMCVETANVMPQKRFSLCVADCYDIITSTSKAKLLRHVDQLSLLKKEIMTKAKKIEDKVSFCIKV